MGEVERLNGLTKEIIGAAIGVHEFLGPGLLESTYGACLASELLHRGLRVEEQKALPVVYRERRIECGYRVDILVEGAVIVELKAVDLVLPVHKAQLLSYLRLSNLCIGLLLNFHVRRLTEGVYRIVNNLPDSPRPLR